MPNRSLDQIDCRILDVLQRDGRISNLELAELVALSPSPCLRRVRRLEKLGFVNGYAALLDFVKLGLGVVAFVSVSLEKHNAAIARAFKEAALKRPEVMVCYATSGDADYLMRVVVPDLEAYSRFVMRDLLQWPGVASVRSTFALETVKMTTSVSLDHLVPGPPVRKRRARSKGSRSIP
jgi:Lrp/AsnC family transcriptional regulator, leucine-responsive regulatory protein